LAFTVTGFSVKKRSTLSGIVSYVGKEIPIMTGLYPMKRCDVVTSLILPPFSETR
jgi:hypothetical protein